MILICLRSQSDDSDNENGFENGKKCECHTCNEIRVGHVVKRLHFKFYKSIYSQCLIFKKNKNFIMYKIHIILVKK